MTEIEFDHNGIIHKATYEVIDDTLIVSLPDGSTRETVLRGLHPSATAMTHLRSFVLHYLSQPSEKNKKGLA